MVAGSARNEFAGLGARGNEAPGSAPDTEDLRVLGFAVDLARDDAAAARQEGGRLLVPCLGDASVMVDRFDVRCLLPTVAGAPRTSPGATETPEDSDLGGRWAQRTNVDAAPADVACSEDPALGGPLDPDSLDFERFAELPSADSAPETPPLAPPVAPPPPAPLPATAAAANGDPATPYDPAGGAELPAELYTSPGGLPGNVREDRIIHQTAAFVRASGGQAEFVLAVRHARDPRMHFLRPEHPLHAYYQWVLRAAPHVEWPGGGGAAERARRGEDGEGRALVGYSSSDEEDAAAEPGDGGEEGVQIPERTRALIERMASRVATNGAAFEARVRSSAQASLLPFLSPTHPHFWFYRQEIERRCGDDVAAEVFAGLAVPAGPEPPPAAAAAEDDPPGTSTDHDANGDGDVASEGGEDDGATTGDRVGLRAADSAHDDGSGSATSQTDAGASNGDGAAEGDSGGGLDAFLAGSAPLKGADGGAEPPAAGRPFRIRSNPLMPGVRGVRRGGGGVGVASAGGEKAPGDGEKAASEEAKRAERRRRAREVLARIARAQERSGGAGAAARSPLEVSTPPETFAHIRKAKAAFLREDDDLGDIVPEAGGSPAGWGEGDADGEERWGSDGTGGGLGAVKRPRAASPAMDVGPRSRRRRGVL
ncbi:unnamed protein product [Pedinophyceae sp. YPF-701]|nr:unnamed protein product [Pedinophyceae sp. YPF-701]